MNTVTVNDIFVFLDKKFPTADAADFDNTGILVGDRNSEVKKALITLDCDITSIETAVKCGCNLIITHHPVIFGGLKNVLANSVVYELVKNRISVISMHTNLDVGAGGVNDCLCNTLGLSNVTAVIAHDGFSIRTGEIQPQSANQFAKHISKCLDVRVKYTPCRREIRKILVCSGSGGEFLSDAAELQCDALVTADVKHNIFIDSQIFDIAVYDAGHFNTEDVVIEPLAEILRAEFKNTEFVCSHNSPIKYT